MSRSMPAPDSNPSENLPAQGLPHPADNAIPRDTVPAKSPLRRMLNRWLGRSASIYAGRSSQSRRRHALRRVLTVNMVQSLEPRLLLAATPLVVDLGAESPDVANDLTLRVTQGTSPLVQVVDTATQNVVTSRALADTSEVSIRGSAQSDVLTVDLSNRITIPVNFDGGAGAGKDQLKLTGTGSGTTQFLMQGPDKGRVLRTSGTASPGEITFSGVESLTDSTAGGKVFTGTADADSITFRDSGARSDGTMAIDFSQTIGDKVAGLTLSLPAVSTLSSLSLRGEAGGDTISIEALDDAIFRDVNHSVSVDAGEGNDLILLTEKNSRAAYNMVGGGGVLDSLQMTNDSDMTLSNSLLTVGVHQIAISEIETSQLTGGPSDNTLNASAFSGNVALEGLAGNDVLIAGSGNDRLEGGAGFDSLEGGAGDDVYEFRLGIGASSAIFPLGADQITEASNGGTDTLDLRGSPVGLFVDLSRTTPQPVAGPHLAITLSAADAFENVFGGNFDDVLTGNSKANEIRGRGGNDRISGGDGDDTLSGDAGDDSISGGRGADRIDGGTNFDVLIEEQDADMLLSPVALTIGTESPDTLNQIERAELTGGDSGNRIDASTFTGDVQISGRGGNDQLLTGPGNDILVGGPGDDVLTGGLGDDRYAFDASLNIGSDRVDESPDGGTDTLDFSATEIGDLRIDLGFAGPQRVQFDNLILNLSSGSVIENAIGGLGNDRLIGNDLDNVLTGRGGDDTLIGGDGRDTVVYSADGNDTFGDQYESFSILDEFGQHDHLQIEDLGGPNRTMRLRSLAGGIPTFEFTAPLNTLSIDTGVGVDLVEILSLNDAFTGTLILSDPEDLSIAKPLKTGGRNLELRAGRSVHLTSSVDTGGGDLTISAGASVNAGLEFTHDNPRGWLQSHADKALVQTSTSGSGTGMQVDIEVDTFGKMTVSIVDPGSGYRVGDQVRFANPQGTSGTQPMVLEIKAINGALISTRNLNTSGTASKGDSGNVRFSADHILLSGSSLLADAVGSTGFRSGNLTLEVNEVAGFDVQGLVNFDASMVAIAMDGSTIRGGDVTMSALANNTRLFFDEDTLTLPEFVAEKAAGILEGLATVGGAVSFSHADAAITITDDSSIVSKSLDAGAASLTRAGAAPIGLALAIAVGVTDATARVSIAGDITTDDDLTLQARTDNTVDVRADASAILEFGAGIATSVILSDASVVVTEASQLNVGGNLQIQADNFDRNYTAARSVSGPDGSVGLAFAVSIEEGTTRALLDGTAIVTGNILVNALHEKGPILDAKLYAVPAHYNGVHAAAGVNTDSFGDFLDDTMNTQIGIAVTAVKNRLVPKIRKFLEIEDKVSQTQQFDLGAAVAVVVDKNATEARIGDGGNGGAPADVNHVDAKGSVSVRARVKNTPDVTAKSLIKTPPSTPIQGESIHRPTKFAGSFSIAVGDYDNTALAYINDGAVVESGLDLTVTSETRNELESSLRSTFAQPATPDFHSREGVRTLKIGNIVQVDDGHTAGGESGKWYRYRGIDGASVNLGREDFANLNRWDFLGLAEVAAVSNVIADFTTFLASGFGVEKVFNTWSQATSTGEKVAVAGSVVVLVTNHRSDAHIAPNASVNQDPAKRSLFDTQHVVVKADNVNQSIHFGGNLAIPNLSLTPSRTNLDFTRPGAGSHSDEVAIGFAGLVIIDSSVVTAEIHDKAQVFGDSLRVEATNNVASGLLAASGSDGGEVGASGVFAYQEINNVTLARIDDGAIVDVGFGVVAGSNGLSLAVDARDQTNVANALGGVGIGQNVGVGASIGLNNIKRDTRAIIGNRDDVATEVDSSTGFVHVAGEVGVHAVNSGLIGGFAVAAAVAKQEVPPQNQEEVAVPITAQSSSGSSATAGVAVSGDVVSSTLQDRVLASINDASDFRANSVRVHADNHTNLASLAGAVAVSSTRAGRNTGLAGSLSSNAVISETRAFIENSVVNARDSLKVESLQDGFIVSATASGAGAPRSGGTAVAGSVSLNIALNDIEAFVRSSQIFVGGDTSITASDNSRIWSGAGAAAFGGDNGVGVSVSVNMLGFSNDIEAVPNRPGVTRAFIDQSEFRISGGTLTVAAEADDPASDPRIVAVTGSAGIAAGGQSTVGGAGTVAINIIKTSTEAFVTSSKITETDIDPANRPLNTVVTAFDGSGIVAVSGAVGVSQKVSVGAAIGYSEIASATKAFLDNVDLTSKGTLTVSAESEAVIGNAAVGVSAGTGSSQFAGAGSSSVNRIQNIIDAHIFDTVSIDDAIDQSEIRTEDDLRVAAVDRSRSVLITGGFAVAANGASVGAAVGINLIQNQILASIEDASVDATGTASSVSVTASSETALVSVAAGVGAAAGDFALGGSLAVNSIVNTVDAHIANSAHIRAGEDLIVMAVESDLLVSVAGGLAASKKAAVGAALAYTYVGGSFDINDPNTVNRNSSATNQVKGYIRNADVSTGGDLLVRAGYDSASGTALQSVKVFDQVVSLPEEASTPVISITVGGALAEKFALGGSVSTQVIAHDISAFIDGARPVHADGDLQILADDHLTAATVAAAAAGGQVAVGAAVSVQLTRNRVDARIATPATVSVTADGSVLVHANRISRIVPAAGSLAIAKNVSVAGAIVVVDQRDSTTAKIAEDVVLTASGNGDGLMFPVETHNASGQRGLATGHGVLVAATTFAETLGGSVGGGGAAQMGISGSVASITQISDTFGGIGDRAKINNSATEQATANETQSVRVFASDDETLITAAGAASGAGTVGIGAAADIVHLQKSTHARIGSGTQIAAKNDVSVQALASEAFFAVSGSLAVAGTFAGAATADAQKLTSATTAEIGATSTVSADGNIYVQADDSTDVFQVAGGASGAEVSLGLTAAVTQVDKQTRAVIQPDAVINARALRDELLAPTGKIVQSRVARDADENQLLQIPAIAQPEASDPSLRGQRSASIERKAVKGVAVSATALDRQLSAGFTAGGGAADFRLAGTVVTFTSTTEAIIGDRARINTDRTSAGLEQAVTVAAVTDFQHFGLSGGLSGGGGGAIAGADVLIASMNTTAKTGSGSIVSASKDISIVATAQEDLSSITTTLAGGGLAVAGAASTISLTNTTRAAIGDSSTVTAGGNVIVQATDASDLDLVAGSVAVGIGSAGVGGSVTVLDIRKVTSAAVGNSAQVNAFASDGAAYAAIATDISANDSINGAQRTSGIAGLIVQAISSESILTIAASGTGGAFGGLAGVVTFANVDSDTVATIGENAQINQLIGSGAAQSVHVAALNQTEVLSVAGALTVGLGLGGLAGGVDVGLLRNDTIAQIAANARVKAARDIQVVSLSSSKVDSFAASAAAGLVGVAGAVSVYNIGGNLSGDGLRSLTSNSGNGASVSNYINNISSSTAMLGAFDAAKSGRSETNDLTTVRNSVRSAVPLSTGSRALAAKPDLSGTSASVLNNAILEAGEDITVIADSVLRHRQLAGAAQVSAVGFGGSVVVTDVNAKTSAFIGDSTQLTAATKNSFGDINIAAAMDEGIRGESYTGSVGGLAGLGAQVVVVNDHSSSSASLAPLTRVRGADKLNVSSTAVQNVVAEAAGGSAGLVTAGVALSRVIVDGTHSSTVGNSADISGVQSADINTSHDVTVSSRSIAVVAGALSGAGADSFVSVTPSTSATTGNAVKITASGEIALRSAQRTNVSSSGLAVAVASGGAVGASLANAVVSPRVTAELGPNNAVRTAGELIVNSSLNFGSTDLGTKVTATSGSGGLILAGAGANATATYQPVVKASLADRASVETRSLRISSTGKDVTSARATGAVAGAIGVGLSFSNVDADPVYSAQVGADSVLTVIGNTTIESSEQSDMDAASEAAALGIVTGRGSVAFVSSSPVVTAGIGKSTTLNTGNLFVNAAATGDADSLAGGVKSFANGVNVAAVAVGVSDATSRYEPVVTATTADFSQVFSKGDISIRAGSFTTNSIDSKADASSGGILVGVEGARTFTKETLNTKVTTGAEARVDADGDVTLFAESSTVVSSIADSTSIGLIAIGFSNSTIDLEDRTSTLVNAAGRIRAGDDATIRSFSKHNAAGSAFTIGGGGIPVGTGHSDTSVRYETNTTINNFATVTAADVLTVDSVTSAISQASGTAKGDGFAKGVDALGRSRIRSLTDGTPLTGTDADLTAKAALTVVKIGDRATVQGRQVRLESSVPQVSSLAQTLSEGGAAGMAGETQSEAELVTRAEVRMDPLATVRAGNLMQIVSQYGVAHPLVSNAQGPATLSNSLVRGDVGLSFVSSKTFNDQLTSARVFVNGATVEAPEILFRSATPSASFSTDSKLAVKGINFTQGSEFRRGRAIDEVIFANADVNVLPLQAVLEIDEQARILRQTGIRSRAGSGGRIVDGLDINALRCLFDIVNPSTSNNSLTDGSPADNFDLVSFTTAARATGTGTIDVSPGISRVTLENRANQPLLVSTLDLATTAVLTNPRSAVFGIIPAQVTVRLASTAITQPSITITNTGGDVSIAGLIINPTGVVAISASGSVFSTFRTFTVSANDVFVNAGGTVGLSTIKFPIILNNAAGSSLLKVNAQQNALLDVKTNLTGGNTLPALDVVSQLGSADILIRDSLINGIATTSRYSVVRVQSAGDVTLNAGNTDLLLLDVQAPNGLATLRTLKDIRDDRPGDTPTLVARRAILEAGTTIALGFIDTLGGVHPATDVDQIEGRTSSGTFTLVNSGPMVIGGLSSLNGIAGETVILGATGPVTITEDILSKGFISLNTKDTGELQRLVINQTIEALNAVMQLSGWDEIQLAPTSKLLASAIQVTSDIGTPSPADGATTSILGGYTLNGTTTFDVPDGPATTDVLLSAQLSGTGSLRKTGSGTMLMNGGNSYTGTTLISGGTLLINGNQPSSTVLLDGGTLAGYGSIGEVKGPSINPALISPGAGAPGKLTTQNLTLTPKSTLQVQLNGTATGLFDTIVVAGAVDLSNASLDIVPGTPVRSPMQFRIVDNDGTDAITGTFAGWPEGALIPVGDLLYGVTYRGGSGNDVVLTIAPSNTTVPLMLTAVTPTEDMTPAISWLPVSGAVRYEVWISNISTNTVLPTVTVNNPEFTPPDNLGIGSYRVWVRSENSAGVKSAWSLPIVIRINTSVTLNAIELRQAVPRPEWTWQPLPGAVRYEIWLRDVNAGTVVERDSAITETRWTPPVDLAIGHYRLWVRGISADGVAANWSPLSGLLTDVFIAPAPAAVTPLEATFDRTPTFQWTPVKGASEYLLRVRNANTGIAVISQRVATNSLTVATPLPDGPYLWEVRAIGTKDIQSAFSRSIRLFVGGRPTIFGPSGTTIAKQPVFSWSAVHDAARYELRVDRTDVVQNRLIERADLTVNTFTPATALASGAYRFWVRAVSVNGEFSPWSVVSTFTIASVTSLGSDLLTDLSLIVLPAIEGPPSRAEGQATNERVPESVAIKPTAPRTAVELVADKHHESIADHTIDHLFELACQVRGSAANEQLRFREVGDSDRNTFEVLLIDSLMAQMDSPWLS